MKFAQRTFAWLACAGFSLGLGISSAQAAFGPCSEEDFEKFALYDAVAMNTHFGAEQLRRIFSEQYGLELGALNDLHARCNYALSARFERDEQWEEFYRISLQKLKAFCTNDPSPVYCAEALQAER